MNKREYATEEALCADFVRWVRDDNGGGGKRYEPWTVYPETGGFDLLLVDHEGRQLGIEAKLKMNAKVLTQALPGSWDSGQGPDWRGILVPAINADLSEIAKLYGLVVFTPDTYGKNFNPYLYQAQAQFGWHDFNPAHRCELPEMVPDVPAGVPSPVRLTTWKIAALKVLAQLKVNGTITAKDVRAHGIDPRRFCATDGWLRSEGNGNWSRGTIPAFDEQHPAEFAKLVAKLMPTQPAPAPNASEE